MDIINILGDVLFSSTLTLLSDVVIEAVSKKANLSYADLRGANLSYADLRGADLRGADLRGANLRCADLRGADLQDANLRYANLLYANLRYANLRYANLRYANLYGADLRGAQLQYADLKIKSLRIFTGLYKYEVWAVLFEDGTRSIRMGCLFKNLEEWEEIGGIRKSNLNEFPDDGSEKSEERVRAFDVAKAAVIKL